MEENNKTENPNEKLQNQIWTTRASRINAEKRLLHNEQFVQWINIYYSCVTVAVSICLLLRPDQIFSLLTTTMTIALLVVVLFFKSLRFSERAFDFRRIYTELQKLEFQLNRKDLDIDTIEAIQNKYCDLMAEGENHITFDYYKAVWESKREYRKDNSNWKMAAGYVWGVFWRWIAMIVVIVLPILLGWLVYLVKSYGICI